MMLDVFKGDAFSFTELTQAINKLPYVPTRIGQMGLFRARPITTLSVAIEMKSGVLTLVKTQPRGGRGPVKEPQKRNVRDFRTVHLPQSVKVMADEVQGVRAFGSQTETQTAMAWLMEKVAIARQDLDLTHENQRLGAIKGVVLDADGAEIYDYYDEFGLTQEEFDFDLGNASTMVRTKCHQLQRMIQKKLGGVSFSGIHAFVGSTFFDSLVDHESVRDTYLGTGNASELRRNVRLAFDFGNVMFEEYRGEIGGTPMVGDDVGYAFPVGVPGMFESYFAPADYLNTVNTMGLPFYMSEPEMLPFGKGLEYEIQSNPLHINTRPDGVIKLNRLT